jgi:hypothetical protein
MLVNDVMNESIDFMEREFGVMCGGEWFFMHHAKIPLSELTDKERLKTYTSFIAEMMCSQMNPWYIDNIRCYYDTRMVGRSIFYFAGVTYNSDYLNLYFYIPQFFQYNKRHFPLLLDLPAIKSAYHLLWPVEWHHISQMVLKDEKKDDIIQGIDTLDGFIGLLTEFGADGFDLKAHIKATKTKSKHKPLSDE